MPDVFVAPENASQKNEPRLHTETTKDARAHHTLGLFDTYCKYPEGVSFKHQEQDEKIILFTRRHHITNLPWISLTALLLLLPLSTPLLLDTLSEVALSVPLPLILTLLAFYYLVIFSYASINFATWFYNVGIVTQKHIVDIDFSDITYQNVAATKVSMIQDVNFAQEGYLRSSFDYGDVLIQTAGKTPNFEFLKITKPGEVAHTIQKLIGTKEHV